MSENREQTFNKLNGIKNLPAIPSIMVEVTNYLQNENHNSQQLASIVSKDQGLSTKVLAITNSPLFGLQRKVSSIELAIMLLGEKELGNIVIALSMADAVKFEDHKIFSFFEYWKHSMMVATAAGDIAKKLQMNNLASEAFLCGMLHDLGIQLIMQHFTEELKKIVYTAQHEGIDFLQAEQRVLGCSHDEIGRFLVDKWSLPRNICDVLEFHHNPSQLEGDKKLVSIVHLADIMTQEFETGEIFWDERLNFEESITGYLGFNNESEITDFINDYRATFIAASDALVL